MSAECALKSIIVTQSLRKETPEELYQKIRKASHSLVKLMNLAMECPKNKRISLNAEEKGSILKASELGVKTRYSLDIMALYLSENWETRMMESGPISSTILSEQWTKGFGKTAEKIRRLARKKIAQVFKQYRGVKGVDIDRTNARYALFLKNVHIT